RAAARRLVAAAGPAAGVPVLRRRRARGTAERRPPPPPATACDPGCASVAAWGPARKRSGQPGRGDMIDPYGPRSFTRAPRPVTAPGPDRIAIQTPAAWPGTHRRGMFLPDDRCPGEAGSLAAPEHRVQRRSRGPELGRERRPLAGPPGGPRARALRALVAPVGDHGFARTHRP